MSPLCCPLCKKKPATCGLDDVVYCLSPWYHLRAAMRTGPYTTGEIMLAPECPHCHKPIDLMEPNELDVIGLTPNVRAPAVASGALPVWARLRGGKFFLFLRPEVEAYVQEKRQRDFSQVLKRAGLGDLSPAEQLRELKKLEKAIRDGQKA